MIKLFISHRAESDFRRADQKYRDLEPALATRFRKAVRTGFRWIREFPEASPHCDEQHRYCILKTFPYGLVYRLDEAGATIVAVTHFRQLPGYWNEES